MAWTQESWTQISRKWIGGFVTAPPTLQSPVGWFVPAAPNVRLILWIWLKKTRFSGGQLLSLAKLRVIRAQAHLQLNGRSDATSALLSAIRLLGKQPFRRFILDEGLSLQPVVQAALDGERVKVPIDTVQRASAVRNHASLVIGRNFIDLRETIHCDDQRASKRRYLELWRRAIPTRKSVASWGCPQTRSNITSNKFTATCRFDNRARAVSQARDAGYH